MKQREDAIKQELKAAKERQLATRTAHSYYRAVLEENVSSRQGQRRCEELKSSAWTPP